MSSRFEDHVAIGRVQTAYADIVDRRAWDELAGIFTADATWHIDPIDRPMIEITGLAGFRDFVEPAVSRFGFFQFVILNSHIELPEPDAPDHAAARIHMCEIRRDADDESWSTAFGLYQDRYRREGDGWRIEHRTYRSLARTGAGLLPPPTILGGPARP